MWYLVDDICSAGLEFISRYINEKQKHPSSYLIWFAMIDETRAWLPLHHRTKETRVEILNLDACEEPTEIHDRMQNEILMDQIVEVSKGLDGKGNEYLLNFLSGMSQQEISSKHNVSAHSVNITLNKRIRAIKRLLEDNDGT
jgi:DNA-directed RNA polymerase specialized sigma24 family protein